MIVGFTGTRDGMTPQQKAAVSAWLAFNSDTIHAAHHGDCVGADEQFHALCQRLNIPIVIHPPEDDKHRAFCEGAKLVMPKKPYLKRNRAIVRCSDFMLGTPREQIEPAPGRGQGTWSTIRFSRKTCPIAVVYPDGSVERS